MLIIFIYTLKKNLYSYITSGNKKYNGITWFQNKSQDNNPKSHYLIMCYISEPVVRRCSVKRMFLKISQNSQENICAGV